MDILDFVEAHKFKLQEQGQDQGQDQGQGMGHGQAPRQPMSPPGAYSAGPASPSGMTTIMVPSSKVGLIIGRGGESIRDIQQSSGARVQVQPDNGRGAPERPIQLIGLPEQIEYARVRIMEIVNSERPVGIGGGGNVVTPGGYQQRQEYAPQNQAQGFAAPRHAQQQSYGMPPPQQQQQQQDRYGGAAGPMASAMQSMAPPAHVEEMQIPAEAVGIVIGRGGESIKLLQQTSGARIQIIQGQDRSAPFKPVTISGDHAACMRARRMIEEKVDSLQHLLLQDLPVVVLLNTALHHHLATTSRSADRLIRMAEAVTPSSSSSNRRQRWVVFMADTRLNNPSNSTALSRLNLSRLSSKLTQHLPRNTLLRDTNRQGTSPKLRLKHRLRHSPEYAQYAEYYRKLAEKDPNGIVPSDN
ncbi:hypothetical protein LPJ66_004657 [Kickxella alabastrina]|uniref:Uncharacterized protein n=1 Tax=Kickxella alabastrina TaxID=61397 RepID=A0ACC1IKM4_9FUNG|nr:hypothetical protein LPJ66_004657 [Kickxella alabastrina]